MDFYMRKLVKVTRRPDQRERHEEDWISEKISRTNNELAVFKATFKYRVWFVVSRLSTIPTATTTATTTTTTNHNGI